ncbi:hypothetical protein PISMIDRAFT_681270 [Pisolithus microcarpus 441]|uniref:Uncharacterized protein n=1 Tax=Pisolithus microcarpus 441 TaxID=765257 RepID=A0A0C9Z5D5_9AGAM|nr:hypothetical protein PISMIDRAFT_681270 [Pisolithus microcarpus 441]
MDSCCGATDTNNAVAVTHAIHNSNNRISAVEYAGWPMCGVLPKQEAGIRRKTVASTIMPPIRTVNASSGV